MDHTNIRVGSNQSGSQFLSQMSVGSQQFTVTPVLGDLTPSLVAYMGTGRHIVHSHTFIYTNENLKQNKKP